MVQEEGVEPSRPKTPAFETGASASYATPALIYVYVLYSLVQLHTHRYCYRTHDTDSCCTDTVSDVL